MPRDTETKETVSKLPILAVGSAAPPPRPDPGDPAPTKSAKKGNRKAKEAARRRTKIGGDLAKRGSPRARGGAPAIPMHFKRLRDVSLYEIQREIGVYILWNKQAEKAPSYIGEGDVLQRFAAHIASKKEKWANGELDGLIGVVEEGTDLEAKWQAQVVETVLLVVSEELGRQPKHNKKEGNIRPLGQLTRRMRQKRAGRNILKLNLRFTGYDPLLPPTGREMRGPKVVTLESDRPETRGRRWSVHHPWRLRPAR